ncbi:zinc finger protein 862-like [Mercenaria mercenaria]|uniref:zinc finger protein 862-like n=1 Tax=Mercenaria mercenaria TaxID=6596 RepID=UPI00234FA351|nr:zinc finger protein 862-like [Mercenaria mercenaria]
MLDGLSNLCDDYCKKLVAVGCDGASVMLGKNTGAVQRIRKHTDRPWLLGVHCSGHKLELAYKNMVKSKISLYDKVENFLLSVYYFYRNSNLNRAMLKESFKSLGINVVLPTRVGGTRWISHLKLAVGCYLKGYKAISQHLSQLQNPDDRVYATEKGNKAKALSKTVFARDAWHMMHFLLDCLEILVIVSKKFQERTATVSEILHDIESSEKQLEKLKTRLR